MSIHATLDRLVEEGKLVRYLPADGSGGRRGLYLSAALAREISDGNSSVNFFLQRRPLSNLLEKWVRGRRVIVRFAGLASGASLARLAPPPEEVWEFRVTEPTPQLRIFVRFAAPDVLVALLARNRDGLGSANMASGKRGKAWQETMYACESEWSRIFGRTAPFRADTLSDYITRNVSERS